MDSIRWVSQDQKMQLETFTVLSKVFLEADETHEEQLPQYSIPLSMTTVTFVDLSSLSPHFVTWQFIEINMGCKRGCVNNYLQVTRHIELVFMNSKHVSRDQYS